MQLACHALHAGERVVWIDTGAPIPGPRFQEMLQSYRGVAAGLDPASSPPIPRSPDDLQEKFTYFNIHTLPHLLVLFLHPTPRFPPPDTALLIIDNVSAPFATAFPRYTPPPSAPSDNANANANTNTGSRGGGSSGSLELVRKSKLQWAANRKWVVAGDLAAAMNKMAALRNVAVVVVNQVATSLKGVKRAVLKPALAGAAWEVAVGNRIVLWRDFAPYGGGEKGEGTGSIARSLRFAQAVKVGGRVRSDEGGDAVPFSIVRVRKRSYVKDRNTSSGTKHQTGRAARAQPLHPRDPTATAITTTTDSPLRNPHHNRRRHKAQSGRNRRQRRRRGAPPPRLRRRRFRPPRRRRCTL